jgi:hypothetical protein
MYDIANKLKNHWIEIIESIDVDGESHKVEVYYLMKLENVIYVPSGENAFKVTFCFKYQMKHLIITLLIFVSGNI